MQLESRLDLRMKIVSRVPKEAWRARWHTALLTQSVIASVGSGGYGSVALGSPRSVTDEFRQLAEKEL